MVITGASTGIGAACALALDGLGFHVFAGIRRDVDGKALRQRASSRLTPVMLDVTDPASIIAAAREVAGAWGSTGLTGLVNNAGIVVGGPIEILPVEALRLQFETNVVGLVAVTQSFLPLLRRGCGRIVNVGSISGRIATPFVGAYGASKFALEALSDALRVEVQPWGIEVSLIEPGAVATPVWDKSRASAEALRQAVPLERQSLYLDAMAAIEKTVARAARGAISTDAVSRAVVHALTAARPRTRYLIGNRARVQAIMGRLPDRLRDWLLTRAIGLPPRNAKV